jgi:excisionase family DNA binding protein
MGTLKIATEDKLYTPKEAAALLGITVSTVRSWFSTGKLRRIKVGRLTRALESELLAMITPEDVPGHGAGEVPDIRS